MFYRKRKLLKKIIFMWKYYVIFYIYVNKVFNNMRYNFVMKLNKNLS